MNRQQWRTYWTLARTRSADFSPEQVDLVMDDGALIARAAYLDRGKPDPLAVKSYQLALAIHLPHVFAAR